MIRALIFPFDGLILETAGPEFQSWQEIYQAHGVPLSCDLWALSMGTTNAFHPYDHLEAQLGRPLHREAVRAGAASRGVRGQ